MADVERMSNILDRGFAMTDFPRSLIEFQRRFADEGACADHPLAPQG